MVHVHETADFLLEEQKVQPVAPLLCCFSCVWFGWWQVWNPSLLLVGCLLYYADVRDLAHGDERTNGW